MSDWRRRLANIVQRARPEKRRRKSQSLEQARERLSQFFDDVVVPAFEELKAELGKQGREPRVRREALEAELVVYKDGEEEFRYGLQGRALHRFSFAFPHLPDDDANDYVCYVEVVLQHGTYRHRMTEVSKEAIINHFLDEFEKWMNW